MPFTDHHAAAEVRSQREARGLSPEALSREVNDAASKLGWPGGVDAHTIRRIERDGHVPSLRVQFVLASYFGEAHSKVWLAQNARIAQVTHRRAVAA